MCDCIALLSLIAEVASRHSLPSIDNITINRSSIIFYSAYSWHERLSTDVSAQK